MLLKPLSASVATHLKGPIACIHRLAKVPKPKSCLPPAALAICCPELPDPWSTLLAALYWITDAVYWITDALFLKIIFLSPAFG